MHAESEVAEVWRPDDVVLDLYEVRDVVRSGGMGLVYRVRHRGWNIDLAVKTPRRALVSSVTGLRNFEAEAETWVGLGLHPHIVNCVYVRRLGGMPRVFAEWVDGGSLAEAIRERRIYEGGPSTSLGRVLDVAIQSAWGLDHAHGRRLVHQDVKPANVMLTRDGTVKVTDFGLARARAAAGESTVVLDRASLLVSCGGLTPAYCSPEQARAAAGAPSIHLTRATDFWSWALSVFEMFAGGPPCRYGQSAGEEFREFVQAGVVDPRLPAMPLGVVDLLRRCFVHDPAARPDRLDELADELIALYGEALGEPYRRTRPVAATLLADELSNQALSFLDLGRPDRAEDLWERALQADPHHPHAVYNRGLHWWRDGRLTDAQLVTDLEAVRLSHSDDWVDEYLLGLVHRERGDPESAAALLRDSAGRAPGEYEVAAALASVEREPLPRRQIDLAGHEEEVYSVAVTTDGRVAVSGDSGGTVRVWDVETGRCLNTLSGNKHTVRSIALSADGRVAVVAGGIKHVSVWDLVTGQRLHELSGHSGWVSLAAMTPDGRRAVTHGHDGMTMLWDLQTGRRLNAWAPTGSRRFAESGARAISADGRLVTYIDRRGEISVLEPETGRLLHTLAVGWNTGVIMSGDGRIAMVHRNDTVRMFDLATGRLVQSLNTGFAAEVGISGDRRLVFSEGGEQARAWEVDTGRCRLTLSGHFDVKAVALSGDGRVVVTSAGQAMRVREVPPGVPAPWSYSRPRPPAELTAEADRAGAALAHAARLAGSGRIREAADELRVVRALPGHRRHPALVERWREMGRLARRTELVDSWPSGGLTPPDNRPGAFTFNGQSPTVLAPNGNELWVFDLDTGQLRHTLEGHRGVEAIALSDDGRVAVSGHGDGRMIVWDPVDGRRLHDVLEGHHGGFYSLVLSADARLAVSGTFSGQVGVWDVQAGRCLNLWAGHASWVASVALSADHRLALSGSEDALVQVWDLRTGRLRRTLRGHEGWVWSVAVSADGRRALSSGVDGTVRVWKPWSGRQQLVLRGHTNSVGKALMSADGHLALSMSADASIRLWDLDDGQCLRVLQGHTSPVHSLAVTPDFNLAVSSADDGDVRLWDLGTGTCLRTFEGYIAKRSHVAGGYGSQVAISEDGWRVLSGGLDGHLRAWTADWEYEFPESAGAGHSQWSRLFRRGSAGMLPRR